MSDEDDSQKTEEPSDRRLDDARRKGNVPSSREAANLTGVFALFLLAMGVLPAILPRLAGALGGIFTLAGDVEIGVGAAGLADLGGVTAALARALLPLLGLVALLMLAFAVLGVLIQGQTVVAAERIRPKLSHLSPGAGVTRLFGAQALVEFLKNLVKLGVVAWIALAVSRRVIDALMPGALILPETLAAEIGGGAARMLAAVACFLVPVVLADIFWKRFQWKKKLMMTLQQVKDEAKDSEGAPETRRRRIEARDRLSRNRIQSRVPKATVVLTNPTHYAVALRYDRGQDAAPVCVAKGADLMAAQIRALAREAGVPVIENRPLARALWAEAEVDRVIPDAHWQAVAQFIAYVMDLRKRLNRPPPKGSRIRTED